MTLGDEEATRRGGQKTVLERKGPPTFNCGAEIVSKTEVRVHRSLEATVDAVLAGRFCLFKLELLINAEDIDINAAYILIQQHIKILASVNFLLLAHLLAKRSLTKR